MDFINAVICSFFPAIILLVIAKAFSRSKVIKGNAGEVVTTHILRELSNEYTIFNNLTIKYQDLYTQIDHVVISPYGVFVIETKVRAGTVYGNSKSRFWKQYSKGSEYKFQNPIRQNYLHVQVIKEILSSSVTVNPISIIAFSGFTKLHIYEDTPKSAHVIHISDIAKTIMKSQSPIFTQSELAQIKETLKERSLVSRSYEQEHLEYLKKIHEDPCSNANQREK